MDSRITHNDDSQPENYDAPQVEAVLTPDEMEREVHYAGFVTIDR